MNKVPIHLVRFLKSCMIIPYFTEGRLLCNESVRKPKYFLRVLNGIQKCHYCQVSGSNLSLENSEVQRYISSIVEEYKTLNANEEEQSSHNVRKRIAELSPLVHLIYERTALLSDSEELKSMKDDKSTDNELKKLALEEILTCNQKIKELDEQILSNLVPKDPYENNGALLEVSAGVGGKEAMLFSKELFEMYKNYALFRGWDVQIALMDVNEIGGLRHSSALISGDGPVFGLLSQEAGVHRVQRVPVTEKSGRIHTSTVRVAVLPQPTELEIEIKKEDLKIDTKRSSGAGGQHVNTTDSAVRITHIPTGIFVECQTDRSQFRNKELALQKLRVKLYEEEKKKIDTNTANSRKEQIGDAARSEKIRTYNFNQDRITDHRISYTLHNLEDFLEGGELLNDLINNLYKKEKEDRLIKALKSAN